MTGKEKLIFLIKEYEKGGYSTNDFCDLFCQIFDIEMDDSEFVEFSEENFLLLSDFVRNIASRFSSYEEDHAKYPKVYSSVEEVNLALNKIKPLILQ